MDFEQIGRAGILALRNGHPKDFEYAFRHLRDVARTLGISIIKGKAGYDVYHNNGGGYNTGSSLEAARTYVANVYVFRKNILENI